MTHQMAEQVTTEAPKSARELKAEAKAAKARAKAMRRWYMKKRFWLFGVIAVIVIASVASSGGSKSDTKTDTPSASPSDGAAKSSSNTTDHPPQNDVTIEQCTGPNVLGMPEASGKIVNNSSKSSNYMFHIEFLDGSGTRIASGYVVENDVAPGQTATWNTPGDAQTAAPTSCRVVDVERFAA
jgi:hypothetical protein